MLEERTASGDQHAAKPRRWRERRYIGIAEGVQRADQTHCRVPSAVFREHQDSSPAIARLTGLRLSCWHCHAVEHYGRTGDMVLSRELTPQALEDTIEHF